LLVAWGWSVYSAPINLTGRPAAMRGSSVYRVAGGHLAASPPGATCILLYFPASGKPGL